MAAQIERIERALSQTMGTVEATVGSESVAAEPRGAGPDDLEELERRRLALRDQVNAANEALQEEQATGGNPQEEQANHETHDRQEVRRILQRHRAAVDGWERRRLAHVSEVDEEMRRHFEAAFAAAECSSSGGTPPAPSSEPEPESETAFQMPEGLVRSPVNPRVQEALNQMRPKPSSKTF